MNPRHFGSLFTVPAALALTLLPLTSLRADPDSPEVSLSGALASVAPDGTHADIVTDSGLRYTLDVDHADITAHGAALHTDALRPGMHVQVVGEPLSDETIRADRIQVAETAPPAPSVPNATADSSDTLHLRGTVVSVDQQAGSFVVHVNDHARTVFVDDSTQISPAPGNDGRLPIQSKDRMTVSGLVRADGTVVADTVEVNPDPLDVDLTGPITRPSRRYGTRDIKVRDGAGREVTVEVPSDIPILRGSRPVSIHTLGVDDVVHVSGIPDGDAVQATRIEVVSDTAQKF